MAKPTEPAVEPTLETVKPVLADDVVNASPVAQPKPVASSIRDIDPRDIDLPDIRTILGEFDQIIPNQVECHPAWHASWVDDRNLMGYKTMGWRFVRRDSVVEHSQDLGLYDVRVSGSHSALNYDAADCIKNTDGHYLMLAPKQIANALYTARAKQSSELLSSSAQRDSAISDMERLGNHKVAEQMYKDSSTEVTTGDLVQGFNA
jgi:hypothetical protein